MVRDTPLLALTFIHNVYGDSYEKAKKAIPKE